MRCAVGFLLTYLGLAPSAAAQGSTAPPPSYPPAYPPSNPPFGPGSTAVPGTPWAAPSSAANGGAYFAPVRPYVLPYTPGSAPPPGYHFEENPRKGLIVAGALTLGIPYLISMMIGGASRSEADRWLLVPVVGPVGSLSYGMRGCDEDVDPARCTGNVLIVVGLAFDLAAQTAGAILLTMGFVFPKKQWVSDYEVVGRSASPFTWSLSPRVDAAGRVGLTLSGTIY